jgi:flagellar biosynthesis/type III secretory pathway M-ring protein FliF/YscJ
MGIDPRLKPLYTYLSRARHIALVLILLLVIIVVIVIIFSLGYFLSKVLEAFLQNN